MKGQPSHDCAENDSLHGVLEMHGPELLAANTSLGPDISPLDVLVEYVDANILHIKIGAAGRYEVPKDQIFTNTGMGESCLLDGLQAFHEGLALSGVNPAGC